MSLFGKLIKTTFDVATSPLDMAKDLATMGGVLTDKREPYTVKKLKKIIKDGGEIQDEIDDL